jgi:hypothetical protein
MAQTVGIYSDPGATDCHIQLETDPWTSLFVFIENSPVDLIHIRFSAPKPACFPGTWLFDNMSTFLASGTTQIGIDVSFGQCLSTPIHVLNIVYMPTGPAPERCCVYPVLAHPDAVSGEIELIDCLVNTVNATGRIATLGDDCEVMQPSHDPSPPDSATGVGVDTPLTWDFELPVYCDAPLGINPFFNVYFGTTPDPPLVASMLEAQSFDPGPLQAQTMYHWKVLAFNGLGSAMGPLWTFTTEAPVANKPSTWGAIKALFDTP